MDSGHDAAESQTPDDGEGPDSSTERDGRVIPDAESVMDAGGALDSAAADDAAIESDASLVPDAAPLLDAAIAVDATVESDTSLETDAASEPDGQLNMDSALEADAVLNADAALEEDADVEQDAAIEQDAEVEEDAAPEPDMAVIVDSRIVPDLGPFCGNGIVEDGETCDGDCPDNCDRPENACSLIRYVGAGQTCDATCVTDVIEACVSDDGCCPDGCSPDADLDCIQPAGAACQGDEYCLPGVLTAGLCIENGWSDGYCSSNCVTDDDCNAGSICAGRYCLTTCDAADECRDGYTCGPYMGSLDDVCTPTLIAQAQPGAPCDDASTCLGTPYSRRCLDADDGGYDGVCSARCLLDSDCPGESQCAFVSRTESLCLQPCENPMDCRDNYACWDGQLPDGRTFCLPYASGDGVLGAVCETVSDCAGALEGQCYLAEFGGYCTRSCSPREPCPDGAHCGQANPETGEGLCLLDCEPDGNDCDPRHSCFDADRQGPPECWPSGNAEVALGAPCENLTDCGGGPPARCLYTDLDRGYCSQVCNWQISCPEGSHCAFRDDLGSGFCKVDCDPLELNACRPGFFCADTDNDGLDECSVAGLGIGRVGAPCESMTDCQNGIRAYCLDETFGLDGYCSRRCRDDAACPFGSHCGYIDAETERGWCLADCGSNADCRFGYGCYNSDKDANEVLECGPIGVGPGRIGDRCTTLSDCRGQNVGCANNFNWTRGYCYNFYCTAEAGCPDGSHCAYIEPETQQGVCLRSCGQDEQCQRDAYGCADDDNDGRLECIPFGIGNVPAGGACETKSDCAGGARSECETGWPRGFCYLNVGAGENCPAGSHVANLSPDNQTGLCFPDCSADEDCRAGYRCGDGDGDNVLECLPAGSGTTPIGGPCRQIMDCTGGANALCIAAEDNPAWLDGYCLITGCEQQGNACPDGSVCTLIGGGPEKYCMQSCTEDADCIREGYRCLDADGNQQKECFPG